MSEEASRPTFGSLFAGIGGFDLGLERAGWECKWQVEIDPFCRKVLERHWPEVPRHEDIKNVLGPEIAYVDIICGGFPCPVVSSAARGRNVGEWLWPEFFRIIDIKRPKFVLLENVDGLRRKRLGEILRDLASIGYDAEWKVVRASSFGAPHKRARLWLVAYPHSYVQPDGPLYAKTPLLPQFNEVDRNWPDPPERLSVDDGFPYFVGNAAYGRAVIPQIAEWLGRGIIAHV